MSVYNLSSVTFVQFCDYYIENINIYVLQEMSPAEHKYNSHVNL